MLNVTKYQTRRLTAGTRSTGGRAAGQRSPRQPSHQNREATTAACTVVAAEADAAEDFEGDRNKTEGCRWCGEKQRTGDV